VDEHGAVAGLLLEVNVEGLVLLGEGEHLGAVEGRDVVADDLDSFLAKVLVVDTEVAGGRTEVDELGQRAWERERGGERGTSCPTFLFLSCFSHAPILVWHNSIALPSPSCGLPLLTRRTSGPLAR